MQHRNFILRGTNIKEPITELIQQYHQESFISEYPGGFMLAYEDFSFLNSNYILICLRVDYSEDGVIKIEMLSGGAAGAVMLGDLYGSENRRIKHFNDRLEEFCKERGIEMEM